MMSAPCAAPPSQFPAVIADAVKQAVETTFASILGQSPACKGEASGTGSCAGVLGTISFMGEIPWTFSLMIPEATAPGLVVKFAGFETPYDSPDMGDVIGELANVIAGDIVARCEARRIKAQMSLPMIARGSDIEMLTPPGLPSVRLLYEIAEGGFWIKLGAAKVGNLTGRRPGS